MRVPFARSKAPPAASPTAEPAPCANCAAPMAVGQDWCVACGTAVAGRLGRSPGLRSSLGVVGVTLLLVVGAVAAAYAALSSDSNQAATRTTASVPAGTPVTPDVPLPAAPGVTLPPTVTPAAPVTTAPTTVPVAPKIPAVTPTPAPTAPVTVIPSKPSATTPTTTATTPKTTTKTTPSAKSAKLLLDTDAASVYDPYSLPTSSFGDPAKAIDGDPQTSWTYQLDPATNGKTLFGLAIDLKSRQAVRSLELSATAGMNVEFYGATGQQPVSITDPAWVHLANRRHIESTATIALSTQGKSYRYLLVWITHAPAGVTSGTLGVAELSVST